VFRGHDDGFASAVPGSKGTIKSLAFKVLHIALVLFGFFSRVEGPEIAVLAGVGIFLAGV